MAEQTEKRFTPDEVIARQRNRQLMVITGIIAVLALLVFVSRTTKTTESLIQSLALIGGSVDEPAFEKDAVTRVEIWKGSGEKLVLVKEGGSWRVPSRYNVAADERAVSSLLTRITDSKRLNRPVTTQPEAYVLHQLDDESATHLLLSGKDGELLHVLVGKPDTGNRTFLRYVGPDAPEGIFEATSVGGQFDSLYSQLNVADDGSPDAKRWLDLTVFKPLPFTSVAQRIKLRDGDRTLEFARVPGSDPAGDEWEMVSPRKVKANGPNVRSVIDGLMNFHAADIAGAVSTDGAALGVIDAKKELTVEFTDDNVPGTSRLYFGKQQDGQVAVQLKSTGVGEFVYWCAEYPLSRFFRPTGEFLEKKGLRPFSDGATAQRLTLSDAGKVTKLERGDGAWKLVEPFAGRASDALAGGLVTSLTALQGYEVDIAAVDRAQLKLGPGVSDRWIETGYKPPPKPGDNDDDGAQDAPESPPDAKPPIETDKEDPKTPAPPPLKTVTLYFGTTVDGEAPVLRIADAESDQVFWVPETRVLELFPEPRELQDTEAVGALRFDDKPVEVIVRDGDASLTLTNAEADWQIAGEAPVKAETGVVDELIRSIRAFSGVREGAPETVKLMPENAARSIEVKLGTAEDAVRVRFWFGTAENGYLPVLSQRIGADDKLHWIKAAQVESVFANPADYRVLEPFSVKVRQVLISWTGKSDSVKPKQPRTREQAMELVNRIIEQARSGADFTELQRQHNEDSVPNHVYDVNESAPLVQAFKRLASELKVGEVGSAETIYGIHILTRIE